MNRKGFVYTLEAAIAATLFFSVAIFVVPQLTPQEKPADIGDRMHSSLQTLDKTGELRDNLSAKAIESDVKDDVPSGYSHRVRVSRVNTTRKTVSVPHNRSFSRKSNHTELQVWTWSNDNWINVTFGGKAVLNISSTDYQKIALQDSTGNLNFTGGGRITYDFDTYVTDGSKPSRDNLETVNYVIHENDTREIEVALWR